MHDQNSIDAVETSAQKYQRALDLFTESVLKPDHDLRGCAYNQGCYEDLMEIREHVLEYLKTLKEVTYHTNPCLLYTSPSPRDEKVSRMPSSA